MNSNGAWRRPRAVWCPYDGLCSMHVYVPHAGQSMCHSSQSSHSGQQPQQPQVFVIHWIVSLFAAHSIVYPQQASTPAVQHVIKVILYWFSESLWMSLGLSHSHEVNVMRLTRVHIVICAHFYSTCVCEKHDINAHSQTRKSLRCVFCVNLDGSNAMSGTSRCESFLYH